MSFLPIDTDANLVLVLAEGSWENVISRVSWSELRKALRALGSPFCFVFFSTLYVFITCPLNEGTNDLKKIRNEIRVTGLSNINVRARRLRKVICHDIR